MDHLDKLKTLRDEAQTRIETAKRALDESADGRMIASLDSLIFDLESNSTTSNEAVESDWVPSPAVALMDLHQEEVVAYVEPESELETDESNDSIDETAPKSIEFKSLSETPSIKEADPMEEEIEPEQAPISIVIPPIESVSLANKVAPVEVAPIESVSLANKVAPVEIAPVEIAPVEIAPVEIAPVEIAPVEIAPVEVAPVEVAPVEVAPVEVAPVEVAPVEVAPVEVAPVEVAPVEIAPVEVAPVEIAPVEIAPVEIAPVEVAPVKVAPVKVATVEIAPVEVAPVKVAAVEVAPIVKVVPAEVAETPVIPQIKPEPVVQMIPSNPAPSTAPTPPQVDETTLPQVEMLADDAEQKITPIKVIGTDVPSAKTDANSIETDILAAAMLSANKATGEKDDPIDSRPEEPAVRIITRSSVDPPLIDKVEPSQTLDFDGIQTIKQATVTPAVTRIDTNTLRSPA